MIDLTDLSNNSPFLVKWNLHYYYLLWMFFFSSVFLANYNLEFFLLFFFLIKIGFRSCWKVLIKNLKCRFQETKQEVQFPSKYLKKINLFYLVYIITRPLCSPPIITIYAMLPSRHETFRSTTGGTSSILRILPLSFFPYTTCDLCPIYIANAHK